MLVDSERVLLELKRFISSKSHHGQRDLFTEIGRLEVLYLVEEGLPEKALRLYGVDFYRSVIADTKVGSQDGRVRPVDDHQDRPRGGDSSYESEEDQHAHRGTADDTGAAARSRETPREVVGAGSRNGRPGA